MSDYAALAAQFGGKSEAPAKAGNDYLALAAKFGGVSVAPEEQGEEKVGAGGTATFKNIGMGALKGAADIGSTLLTPIRGPLNAGLQAAGMAPISRETNAQFFADNANPDSMAFKGGELVADIAGTAGAGGILAKGAMAVGRAIPSIAPMMPKLAAALETGGFRTVAPGFVGPTPATTALSKAGDLALRAGAGAAAGGASAGLINPEQANTGAMIGGAMPGVVKAAGAVGNAIAGKVGPEVFDLYKKAKMLGIDIPADRIVNSRPMNAAAASLNYMPFSGRAATESKMFDQMNQALSRTFGQDSSNVTMALRKAGAELGKKFDDVLSKNTVSVDNQFLNELAQHEQTAMAELGPEGARIIKNQIDQILNKGGVGAIDGQAAYNIKKALDRIGGRATAPEAFYARELKKSLMGALDRSLGPQEAAAFKTVRKQYGNMLELENIAANGAEGGVSIGRLANLKNINNPELQDLADIAAQFLKTRESPHGAMQRVTLGALGTVGAGASGMLPLLAGGLTAGRAANATLNSAALKELLLNQQAAGNSLSSMLSNPVARAIPAAISASP